ncbi:MAG: hypothetical protein HN348_33010, partial [Proteobacteria bacterium]|nr:hypothetical protein [Pseudomonadota bacterium]
MFLLLCAAGLASGLPNVDTPLRTGNRAPHDAAVVIGIEDYAFVADVPHAAKDAEAFYDLLIYTVGIPSDHVRLMNGGASREQILGSIDTAAEQVGENGTVWVYFAGHGAANSSTGARMLLGDDVRQDPTVFDSRGVGVDELVDHVKGANLRLITDACYGGRGRSGQDIISGMRFAVPSYATGATTNELYWYAAAGDQLAGPLDEVGHGAFTYLA